MGAAESRLRTTLNQAIVDSINPIPVNTLPGQVVNHTKANSVNPLKQTTASPEQHTTVFLNFLQTFGQVYQVNQTPFKDRFDTTMYPSLTEALRDVLADAIELVQTKAVANHEIVKLVNYLVSFVKGLDSPEWVEVSSATEDLTSSLADSQIDSPQTNPTGSVATLLVITTEILKTNFTIENRNRPVTLFLLELAVALKIDFATAGLEPLLSRAYAKSLIPVKSIADKGVCQQCYYDAFHHFCQRNQLPLPSNYLVWFLKTRYYDGFLSHVKLTPEQKIELLNGLAQFNAKVGAEIIELCL